MCTIRSGDDRHSMFACLYLCEQYLLVIDRSNMSACVYLCVKYFLVSIEIICLHVCMSVHNTCWFRQKYLCLHVCIYVYNTYWWRQTYYVCMSVFMWTILAGDDINNMTACVYLCVQYCSGDDRTNMPACLHLCIQYLLVTTDIVCLHVCIYLYNTCCWREK